MVRISIDAECQRSLRLSQVPVTAP